MCCVQFRVRQRHVLCAVQSETAACVVCSAEWD